MRRHTEWNIAGYRRLWEATPYVSYPLPERGSELHQGLHGFSVAASTRARLPSRRRPTSISPPSFSPLQGVRSPGQSLLAVQPLPRPPVPWSCGRLRNSGRGLVRSCCSSYPGRISRPGFPIEQSARQSSRFTVVGTRLVDLAFWLRSYRHRILCHIFRRFRHVDEAHRRRGRANYASFRLLRRQTQLGRGKNSSVPCNPRQACGRTAKFMD